MRIPVSKNNISMRIFKNKNKKMKVISEIRK